MYLPEPLLGMGTWGMGGKYERDETTTDESISILQLGLSLGLKIIDTAELYGAGLTETIVGRAIKGISREKVCIISKVWKTNLSYDDTLHAAESSLKRLDTPYLDLYLIHWPNPSIAISETMRAMQKLLDDKQIGAVGVSNFSVEEMEEARHALPNAPLAANQFEYNLLNQDAALTTIPYCRKHDMEIIAHRPLAKGVIGKAREPQLEEIAKRYGKTPGQIALNWIVAQGIIPIPATLSENHLRENADALSFSLSKEDVALLSLTSSRT